MRGKRAKALREQAWGRLAFLTLAGSPLGDVAKVKVGRTHGGPAFGKFPYPKSSRYVKKGDFDVLVTDVNTIKEEIK